MIGIGADRQDFANLLHNRSEIPTNTTSSHSSISSLLHKNHHQPLIPNENSQFLKNPNCDDLDINMQSENHHSIQDYSKLQIPGYDDYETVSNLPTIQPDYKFLGSRYQMNHNQRPNHMFYNSMNDAKICSKNPTQEMMMQYQDIKLFNNCEQFLKNSNFGNYVDQEKTDLKMLGKKIENGILTSLDNGLRKSVSFFYNKYKQNINMGRINQ